MTNVLGNKPFEVEGCRPPNEGKGDLMPRQVSEHKSAEIEEQEPEVEDSSSCTIPTDAIDMEGKKKVIVPDVISMTKVLFDRYRLPMYTYLNRNLRNGMLDRLVGAKVRNTVINHEICSFPTVDYWRISRTEFYADIQVSLKLRTSMGNIEWSGYIVCWCEFGEKLTVSFEDLANCREIDRRGYVRLSNFLVPYVTNKGVDRICEEILRDYMPEALHEPNRRIAKNLASKLGLTILEIPVYEHRNVKSIVFFKEDYLAIGEDRTEKDEHGKERHIKASKSEAQKIPANTIVVNTNKVKKDYSYFDIFHECYHFMEHYLFYRLQELDSNDFRQVPTKELIVNEGEEVKDPIYFMEKQADRGGYGFMMPVTHTRELIYEQLERVKDYKHQGEKFEKVGFALAEILCLPHFRIRARLIQLGNIEAKGALNYVQREHIEPFAFDIEAWKEEQHTFIVDDKTVDVLKKKNEDFRKLVDSGKYIYADGHMVKNDPRLVTMDEKENLVLTEWANAHVDECCLRFVRLYVQKNVGRYVYGRMYLDSDFIRQTSFYLNDIINQEQLDELDAKDRFIETFPVDFFDAVKVLREKKGLTYAEMAEMMYMDDSTIQRWLRNPKKYRNEDFLTLLCLALDLPDWISRLVFKRARFQLDEDDKRHRALLHILRVQSADGKDKADEFLKSHGMEPLRIDAV